MNKYVTTIYVFLLSGIWIWVLCLTIRLLTVYPVQKCNLIFQCKLHLAGTAAGNLCPDLCSKGKVEYKKCSNYRGGKQVIITRWDQITTVFKSKRAYFNDFDSVAYPGEKGPEPPQFDSITSMIKDSIEFNFIVQISDDKVAELPNMMWTRDLTKFERRNKDDPQRLLGAYQSLYSLLQQDEYLFVKYFQTSKHIPQIYGSCGHFYAMEYLPPGKLLSPGVINNNAYFSSWKDRVGMALGLLDLIYSFEKDFPHKLHICDVKGENFGKGDDSMVKLIDTDAVFFDPKLKDVLVNDTCKVHDDCNFFDCKGYCNLRAERCTNRRANSNLQVKIRCITISTFPNFIT